MGHLMLMQVLRTKALPNQSLWDVAISKYGTLEVVPELLTANNQDTYTWHREQELTLTDSVKAQDIYNLYIANQWQSATIHNKIESMITLHKLGTGQIEVRSNGNVIAVWGIHANILKPQDLNTLIVTTDSTINPSTINEGFEINLSNLDMANCEPVVQASTISELLTELSNVFFSIFCIPAHLYIYIYTTSTTELIIIVSELNRLPMNSYYL